MQETAGRLSCADGAALAWRRVAGEGPTVLWLGGFRSDMAGIKAGFLAEQAAAKGWDFLRFDYSGHGESDRAFEDGTIGRWRDDALLVLDRLVEGPALLVGSSMGGWIACLVALARPERVKALALIAPAADFTAKLMEPEFDAAAHRTLETDGRWIRASAYDPEGYPITRALIEDGRRWNILDAPVPIRCPVGILQGEADSDVPWRHALRLHEALQSSDAAFTLVRDADHSFSRPQDLARLVATVAELREAAR
ncbi:MAG TPA: alpha/beta hydrolase [Caulobacteraceae bacterium]|jgi:hypothetical protein